jgi:hypothetical protein
MTSDYPELVWLRLCIPLKFRLAHNLFAADGLANHLASKCESMLDGHQK